MIKLDLTERFFMVTEWHGLFPLIAFKFYLIWLNSKALVVYIVEFMDYKRYCFHSKLIFVFLTKSYTICSGCDSTVILVPHSISRGLVSSLTNNISSSFSDSGSTIFGVIPFCGEPTTLNVPMLLSKLPKEQHSINEVY